MPTDTATVDRVALFTIPFSILIFGVVFLLFNPVNFNIKIPVLPTINIPKLSRHSAPVTLSKESSILGATTEQTCPDVKTQFNQYIHTYPDIKIKVETAEKIIKTTQFQNCFELTANTTETSNCQPKISISSSCVSGILATALADSEPQETIRSPDSKFTVQSRINDWQIDFVSSGITLAKTLQELYVYDVFATQTTSTTINFKPTVFDSTPNTSGTFAPKYIEVDGSRQLMFLWKDGNYTTYKISGAFAEYNPVGIFQIGEKAKLAWSSTASKWMPYWQAFTYDKKQKAWLGIHALVYWFEGFAQTGNRVFYEPESNIGTPKSTGCLRLTKQDAKTVYEWTSSGDFIIVHQ